MKIIIFSTKEFLKRVLRGNKFRLDCGHLWTPLHPWTNTAVFLADGRVICHDCYLWKGRNMQKKLRTLVYHPGRKSTDIPCLLIGGKKLAQKYGWVVSGLVEILELPRGIFIRKIPPGEVKKDSLSERSGE